MNSINCNFWWGFEEKEDSIVVVCEGGIVYQGVVWSNICIVERNMCMGVAMTT